MKDEKNKYEKLICRQTFRSHQYVGYIFNVYLFPTCQYIMEFYFLFYLPSPRLTSCKGQVINISHVSGIRPAVPLPCVLADCSDPHHAVTDCLAAAPHRHTEAKQSTRNCQTRCQCFLPELSQRSERVLGGGLSARLSKSPHHSACSAYAGCMTVHDCAAAFYTF